MSAIHPARLAALSGRPAWTLGHALAGLGSAPGSGPPQLARARQVRPLPKWPAPVTAPARPLIDTWLAEDPAPGTTQIWKRLVDDHDLDIAYGTVAQYLARHRPPGTPANSHARQPPKQEAADNNG